MWKEIRVDNWLDFNHHIDKLQNKEWIFRGQKSVDWDLQSSFFREVQLLKDYNHISLLNVEKKLVNEFKSSVHLYSEYKIEEPKDEYIAEEWMKYHLEFLSIMQHYGTPTRLLDWTYSPYIASFFAIDGATDDFCIYALNSQVLKNHDIEKFGKREYSAMKSKIHFETSNEPELFLFTYEPFQKNERSRVQQGLFLVPSRLDRSIDEILQNYKISSGILNNVDVAIKFIFDKNHLIDYWNKLRQINITHETIYPGFEGFCKSLKLGILDHFQYDWKHKYFLK